MSGGEPLSVDAGQGQLVHRHKGRAAADAAASAAAGPSGRGAEYASNERNDARGADDDSKYASKEGRLTLMEEVYMLGLKDREVRMCAGATRPLSRRLC